MARYNISLPSDIMDKVDKYKEFLKLTKSGFISKALESYFIEVEKKILEDKKKKSIEDIIKIREKIGPSLKGWDSTTEIRKIRDTRWVKDKRWQDIEK